MREPIISTVNLTKQYKVYDNNHQKLRYELFGRKTGQEKTALENVAFDIYPGEKVALIGRKGAGVSTLMRILAGILIPDEGSVYVNGKIDTYLEHRQGFDSSLTGRENMRILADIRGIPKSVFEEHEQEILEFAGAAGMENIPMKDYPAGAATRIGFALSTVVKPEILLFDTTFEFGFGKNAMCRARLEELIKGEDSTLVMNMNNYLVTRRLCRRGIVLDKGKVVFDGKFLKAVRYYKDNCKVTVADATDDAEKTELQIENKSDEAVYINEEIDTNNMDV